MNALKHLGIIVDGNRRYAKKSGLSLAQAYWVGATKSTLAVKWAFGESNLPEVTVYAISFDNLKRSMPQLNPVFKAQNKTYEGWLSDPFFEDTGLKVNFYGLLSALPAYYQETCKKLEAKTSEYEKKKLNILVGYNGQIEISKAVSRWLEGQKEKAVSILLEELSGTNENGFLKIREHIGSNLDIKTRVDLLVRTGFEQRLSGFLTWQSEYAELYNIPKYWPEVTKKDLGAAIEEYKKRKRRQGK